MATMYKGKRYEDDATVQALYASDLAKYNSDLAEYTNRAEAAMLEVKVRYGDKVEWYVPQGFALGGVASGTVVRTKRGPRVRFDAETKAMFGKASYKWHKGFLTCSSVD